MKFRLFSFLVLFLLLTIPVRSVQYDTEQMEGLVPKRGAYKHKRKIAEQYDQYKKLTTVLVRAPMPLSGSERLLLANSLEFAALFTYPGLSPVPPPFIGMMFHGNSKDWKYLRGAYVYAMADGESFELGKFEPVQQDVRYGGRVDETIFAAVPLQVFLRIALGRVISFQIGGQEFKMKEDFGEALRDFASRMRTPGGKLEIQQAGYEEKGGRSVLKSAEDAATPFGYKEMDIKKEGAVKSVKSEKPSSSRTEALPPAPLKSEKVNFALESTPAGAVILIDGIDVGKTPKTIALPAGKHRVALSLFGYKTWEREVDVIEGKMTLRLEPAF